jgi:hypothetical protein
VGKGVCSGWTRCLFISLKLIMGELKYLYLVGVVSLILFSCSRGSYQSEGPKKELMLAASKQAPSGIMVLMLYKDSSFVFRNSGIRTARNYTGLYEINSDTLSLAFDVRNPSAIGEKLLIKKENLTFLDRAGSMQIDTSSVGFLSGIGTNFKIEL